jgi:Zn-dependent peptidase ImmA (M78 family)
MSANWDGAKAKAREIREKYAVNKPPINAFDIANGEGINIVYFTPNDATKDISGLLDKNNKKIYLNSRESAARQNYTLAHELAHLFLDHKANEYGVYRRDSLYSEQKPEKEQEADYFAAELLMPKELVDEVKTRYSLTNNDVTALSKLFGVSPSAMKFRLKNLQRG